MTGARVLEASAFALPDNGNGSDGDTMIDGWIHTRTLMAIAHADDNDGSHFTRRISQMALRGGS